MFQDELGNIYDARGHPYPGANWAREKDIFLSALEGHFQAGENVVIDVTGWPTDAVDDVLAWLTDPANPTNSLANPILIGP